MAQKSILCIVFKFLGAVDDRAITLQYSKLIFFSSLRNRIAYANEARTLKIYTFYSNFSHDYIIVAVSLSKLVN